MYTLGGCRPISEVVIMASSVWSRIPHATRHTRPTNRRSSLTMASRPTTLLTSHWVVTSKRIDQRHGSADVIDTLGTLGREQRKYYHSSSWGNTAESCRTNLLYRNLCRTAVSSLACTVILVWNSRKNNNITFDTSFILLSRELNAVNETDVYLRPIE